MVCVGCARFSDRAQHFGELAIAAHEMATMQVTAAWIVGAPVQITVQSVDAQRCREPDAWIPSGGSQSNHTACVSVDLRQHKFHRIELVQHAWFSCGEARAADHPIIWPQAVKLTGQFR
jgi:hypothetical protein